MTKVSDIVEYLLKYYPINLASNFDEGKVGLQFGSAKALVKVVMIALDGSTNVIKDALDHHVDLLILHHPFMFNSVISFNYDNPIQKKYLMAIQNELNVFAMHTNFDVAHEGMNEILLKEIGVSKVETTCDEVLKDNFIRYGEIPEMTLKQLIDIVKQKYNLEVIRYVGSMNDHINKVGIVGGSGGYELYKANQIGCNAFITGEIKHNQAHDACDLGIDLIEVPHAVEGAFKSILLNRLENAFPDVKFITSCFDVDPFKIG